MRRWRSPLSSLTILGMLFWLGTAMAPSVSPGGNTATTATTNTTEAAPVTAAPGGGQPLPSSEAYCAGECLDPPMEPSVDSDDWRPEVVVPTTVPAPPPRIVAQAPAPAPAPRPVEDWRSLVSTYFAAEHVDLALRIISCESGGDPNAQNQSSGAAGLFQHIPRYWEARVAAAGMPGASIFDPIANVAASAYLAYTDGWSHWSSSAGCWR